jgi:outer membrane lipoprotein-sorting protein
VLGDAAAYTLEMTVVRPGKAERTVTMKGWKKGDALGMVRYTAPPRERGTAYLRSGANTWLYLPSAEKVVRVGAKQNFGGGDFSNADIFRLSLVKDYVPTLVGEEPLDGTPCYKLELKAKDKTIAYDRVLYWVRADGTFFPVRAEYYTISGRKLKWLAVSEVARLGGRARPTRLVMESALEQGARTTLRFTAIDDDVTLDDRMFTPSALERGE